METVLAVIAMGVIAILSFERGRRSELETYNREVDEFNAGFDAYCEGKSIDDNPGENNMDEWRVGWVWAQYNHAAPGADTEAKE